MLCNKCGNNINEGEKFCMKCGTPVQKETTQETPVAIQTTVKEKKTLSPNTKKLIIFSSIGAVTLATVLILLFAVIMPMLNRVDASKYITSSIDSMMLYEDSISGSVSIDKDKIYAEHLAEKASQNTNVNSFSDLLSGLSSYSTAGYLNELLDYCDVDVTVKGDEKASTAITENSEDYDKDNSSFEKCNSNDVLVVTLKWEEHPESQRKIELLEKKAGISFDKSEKTVELSIKDMLTEKELSVREKVNVDLFKYLEDNDLVTTFGTTDGELSLEVGDFTFTEGDYTFTKEGGVIKVSDGLSEEHTIYLNNTSASYLTEGEMVEVSISSVDLEENTENHLNGTDIFFTSISQSYEATACEPMTIEEAKQNIELIKTSVPQLIMNYTWSNVKPVVSEIHFLQSKGSSEYDNRILIVYKNPEYNDYSTISFNNAHISNGKFYYDDYTQEYHWDNDSIEKVKKSSYVLDDDKYTATKIG